MTTRKPEKGTRKRRTIVEETLPSNSDTVDEPDELDINLESIEDTETLQEVLKEFGDSTVLFKVFQQTPTGQAFCFPCHPPIDEEFIQREWGGGDFTIRIYIDGKFRKSIPLKIAPRPRSDSLPQNPNAFGGVSSADRKHSEFLEQMLFRMLENRQTTPTGPSLTDLTTALSNLDGLRGKQENQMDLIMKGIELAQSFNGEPKDWKAEALGMVKGAIPDLMSLLGRGAKPPIPIQGAEGVPMVAEPSEQILRSGIQYLKQLAISQVDPVSIIELVIANASNPQYKPIIDAVLTKEFEYFVGLDPAINSESFKPWFQSVFNGLRSAFSPEHPVELDTPGPVGDAGHVGNNGQSGKSRSKKSQGEAVG
jgi:hypothetical protein